MNERKPYRFAVSRAGEAEFEPGLRGAFVYRDLAIGGATGGAFGAHVIRATAPCEGVTGPHRHSLGFQMVYVLRGRCVMWYEGEGDVALEAGDCVHQPPGILHELKSCSGDCELLEITMPAEFGTEDG